MKAQRRDLILTLIAVILFLTYLIWANPFAAFAEVGKFHIGTYALAVVIDLIGLFFFAASWFLILNAMNVGITLMGAVQLTFTSLFIGWLAPLPLMTEMVRAYLVKDKVGSNLGKALSSVLVHRAYYNIAFGFIIGGTAFITVLNGGEIPINHEVTIFLSIFAVVSVLVFGLALNTNFLNKIYSSSPEWIKHKFFDRVNNPDSGKAGFTPVIEDIGLAINTLKQRMAYSFAAFLMLAFHWSAGSITAYLSAEAMGVHVDIATVIFAYAIVEFLQQMNFLIPSGLGLLDAGLTGAFVLAGVPLSMAAAISLLTRLATYWFEVLVCTPVAIRYGYKDFLARHFKDPSES